MAKLTVSQIAGILGVSSYTIKRWYSWFEKQDKDYLEELNKNGMPMLPAYETVGNTKWRYWEETDVETIKKFKEWVPHTKNGIFKKERKTN